MTPYRLVSLWDMLQLPLGRFVVVASHIVATTQLIASFQETGRTPQFEDKYYQELLGTSAELCQISRDLSFFVTLGAGEDYRNALSAAKRNHHGDWCFDPHELSCVFRAGFTLSRCLHHETLTKVAMILPPEKMRLLEPTEPISGAEVRAQFSSAIYDIDEAAKCIALGRFTASVFHMMRVVELSLRAVAKCLGVVEPKNPNWGDWLNGIRTNCQARTNK